MLIIAYCLLLHAYCLYSRYPDINIIIDTRIFGHHQKTISIPVVINTCTESTDRFDSGRIWENNTFIIGIEKT